MCYPDGGAVDDVLIYKFADDRYMLVVNAANTAKDIDWMKQNVMGDVVIRDESPLWAQLALQGPRFEEVLRAAGYEGEIPAKNYTFTENNIVAGVKCLVSRTGYTGEDGVELYCAAEDAMKLHAALMEAGKPIGMLPCALGARDTLRFEASMPLYGHEMSAKINPVECGVDFAIKFKKPAFIGRDELIKPAARKRIGLKVVKGLAREHMPVLANGVEVGFTTSGGPAPSLGGNYAMALVDVNAPDDAEWTIDVRGRQLPCEKVELPFYKRG
jgi:aminomethyltransferase